MRVWFSQLDDRAKIGYILAILGIGFLVLQGLGANVVGGMWTFLIIAPGIWLISQAHQGDPSQIGRITPGLLVLGTGVILFYQSLTGHWLSWAYMWILYTVLLGMGLRFQGEKRGHQIEVNAGDDLIWWGMIVFIGFGLFFEILIFGNSAARLIFALIGLIMFRLWPYRQRRKAKHDSPDHQNL